MNLPMLLSIIATLIFGCCAIFFSHRDDKSKKELKEREQKQKQRIYEISILREIQERIGYELDMEKVADVITGSLKNLFTYSTVSYILLKDKKLVFKVTAEEHVSHGFVEQVRKSMIASLAALQTESLPETTEDIVTGVLLDDENKATLASFFHIPLIINNEAVGVITLASSKPGLYKQEEITILYQITNLASSTITKLHQVLTTEKGKLMAMIGSLSDGLFMMNDKRELIVINDAAKRFLGLQKDSVHTLDVLTSIPIESNLTTTIDTVLATKQPSTEQEIIINQTALQVFVHPVVDSEQHTIGASILLHDITLERNLSQMKDEFTNMIVHELRAPLTAIRGASQLLRTNIETNMLTPDERRKLSAIASEQSAKLLDLVGSLLDAAKLEAGKLIIQKTTNDLTKAIQQSMAIFEPQANSKHITFEIQSQPLPSFSFDAMRMGQVMNNLLSNSLKFTPEGGKITIIIRQETNVAQVEVSDTGMGIPKDRQEHLFSKFYQVKHDQKDLHYITAGTGLGLYIVKGIIEAHGGTVGVRSEEGKGTTFFFSLPLESPKEVAAQSIPTTVQTPHMVRATMPN